MTGKPDLSMTTNWLADTGCPEPSLRAIAEAGFSHVHWCHQWCTDFIYSQAEVEQIARWLKDFGLTLLGLHGSDGKEKRWASAREYERQAGVELVQNRIDMASRLGGKVVIMHIPANVAAEAKEGTDWRQVRTSLDELRPFARERGVRIAIENMAHDDFSRIRELLESYGPEYLGLCYDSGHGNIGGQGLDHLETVKDRLIALHLHDNDGAGDQHRIPFTGTVDWARLTRILAASSYADCVSMESTTYTLKEEERTGFLAAAFEAGARLSAMIAQERREPATGRSPCAAAD